MKIEAPKAISDAQAILACPRGYVYDEKDVIVGEGLLIAMGEGGLILLCSPSHGLRWDQATYYFPPGCRFKAKKGGNENI